MFNFYDASVIITLLTICITFSDAVSNKMISVKKKLKIVAVCLLLAAVAVCEWTGVRTDGADAGFIGLHTAAKFFEFTLTPFVGIAAASAYGDAKGLKFMLAFASVNAVIQFVSIWTGWVFVVDEFNLYHRADFYWLYIAFFTVSIIYCFLCILWGNKKYRFGVDVIQLLALVFIATGIIIQMICRDIRIDFLCIAISNLILYVRYGNAIMRLDALTKLLNRRCYEISLHNAPAEAVILFFDVNGFKQVNDAFGHAVGDYCLIKVASLINSVYGKYGSCYRIGGDEFCVILTKNIQNLQQLNENFYEGIEELRTQDDKIPTVALGYATREQADENIDCAVNRADEMMYEIKKAQKEQPTE